MMSRKIIVRHRAGNGSPEKGYLGDTYLEKKGQGASKQCLK
jgi:hypothetical protein